MKKLILVAAIILVTGVTFGQTTLKKGLPGTKRVMLWGDRGENKFRYGEMWIFDDVATRNKYFPAESDTAMSPAYKTVAAKMKAIDDESGKYILSAKRVYTDWLVK